MEQNRQEVPVRSPEMEHEAVAGKCLNQDQVQVSAPMVKGAVAQKACEQENIMEEVMQSEGNEAVRDCARKLENAPEAEVLEVLNLEKTEQPRQELQIEHGLDSIGYLVEETVICQERQQMEVAEDIEEPQKYAFRKKDDN